jgi:hypothetical protein
MSDKFLGAKVESLRHEWPYMTQEVRERVAKSDPERFRLANLRMDDPQLPVPDWDGLEED